MGAVRTRSTHNRLDQTPAALAALGAAARLLRIQEFQDASARVLARLRR